jgi:hypothetical protein
MAWRDEIAAKVQAALEAIAGMASVEHSSGRTAPDRVPGVIHYLHADSQVEDDPTVGREVAWGINLYAPILPAADDGNTLALDLLTAVVSALDGQTWTLTGYHAPVAVIRSELAALTDTIIHYYLQARVFLQPTGNADAATTTALLAAVQAVVKTIDPLAAASDCYLCPQGGYLPPGVGVPSLGIRPAGVERTEAGCCTLQLVAPVELIAHVALGGTTSAASVLDAASDVLENNLLGLAGLQASTIGNDSAPTVVRDRQGRWLVRQGRTMEYTMEETGSC